MLWLVMTQYEMKIQTFRKLQMYPYVVLISKTHMCMWFAAVGLRAAVHKLKPACSVASEKSPRLVLSRRFPDRVETEPNLFWAWNYPTNQFSENSIITMRSIGRFLWNCYLGVPRKFGFPRN